MKFTFSTVINQPVARVVELFRNKENLKEWQKELISYECVSGTPNEVKCVTKYVHKSITIIETLLSYNLPHEIKGHYEHIAGKKTVMKHNTVYRFTKILDNKTLFELKMEDVQFVGWLPKLMSKLMGRMFEKYHQDEVDQFKVFAER